MNRVTSYIHSSGCASPVSGISIAPSFSCPALSSCPRRPRRPLQRSVHCGSYSAPPSFAAMICLLGMWSPPSAVKKDSTSNKLSCVASLLPSLLPTVSNSNV